MTTVLANRPAPQPPSHPQDDTAQIVLIHLTDLHFGDKHRFRPAPTVGGDVPTDDSFPSLLEKLKEDLQGADPSCPVFVCVTGDVAQTGSFPEFKEAKEFLKALASSTILGKVRRLDSIFVVPGNHDVLYEKEDSEERWSQWRGFCRGLYGGNPATSDGDWPLFGVIHRPAERLVLANINSAYYVRKGKPDEDRGRLGNDQLTELEAQLEQIPPEEMRRAVRVALIHHHPVLIPSLAEPKRGYDAVHNSGILLSMLRRFGFHLVLHGHKHNPHTFTDDIKPAHQSTSDHPIMIAAGGSVGSTALPRAPRIANCYNKIVVKWHPDGRQSRVRIETRGLRIFNEDGTERLPGRWDWEVMRVDDRHFYDFDSVPIGKNPSRRVFSLDTDGVLEEKRRAVYQETRGNLPVVQVLPSLMPGHHYDAVLWIVTHPYGGQQSAKDIPVEVVWSAGEMFEVVTVRLEDDANFTARLSYWRPMLVQARLRFPDGEVAISHVYARMPFAYG